MIKDRWWRSVVRIENGDFIETKRGIYEEISNVEVGSLNCSQFVYSLTVDDNHTFYVGISKCLTHNSLSGKCSELDFVGNLKGENIILRDVKIKNIRYVKRDTEDLKNLRKYFNSSGRKNFLKFLSENTAELKQVGFSEQDILKMKNGGVPKGWQVHHKLPLDDSGTNNFENLVLIKNDPYHKVITNYQNSFAKQLKVSEIKTVDWPIPEGAIYPKSH